MSRPARDKGHSAIDAGPSGPSAEAGSPTLASEPLPRGLVGRWLATLDPGYFAWVMASGIISVGGALLGVPLLSEVALGVTIGAFLLLGWAYGMRMALFPRRFRTGLRDPTVAMAYFTVVAGTGVLAIRLQMAGHATVALGLGVAAFCAWLVLTYGLPWSIVAAAHRPVLGQFNGTWLVWVVATQSLSIVAAGLAPAAPGAALRHALPAVATTLWGVGVVLYLVLIVIIFLRLMVVEVTPAEMGPAYWIAMGATAISARAAAGILVLHGPRVGVIVSEMHPFLVGLSVVLWAFGTWWIPLLVLLGIWRYLVRGYPKGYEPRLWSVVFPLGMYTVASYTLGRAAGLDFMVAVARVWLWVGVVAWVAVLGLMLGSLGRAVARRRRS